MPAVVVAAIGGVRQDLLGTQLPGLSAGKGRAGPAVTPGGRGQRFLGTIARRQFRLQAGLELAVPMFEIDQEAVDTSGQDSQAAQPAHVGPEVHRIQALRGGIHRKDPGRLVGGLLKQNRIQLLVRDLLAHAPQGLGTHILGGVALRGDIQGKDKFYCTHLTIA